MGTTPTVDDVHRRPLYRVEYEALGRQGVFDDEKVELLDGQIVYAAEEGPPHAATARGWRVCCSTRSRRARGRSVSATPSR